MGNPGDLGVLDVFVNHLRYIQRVLFANLLYKDDGGRFPVEARDNVIVRKAILDGRNFAQSEATPIGSCEQRYILEVGADVRLFLGAERNFAPFRFD